MEYDEEIVQEFLVESYEMLDRLDESFVELEEDPTDSEVIGSIFRVIHTIKGTSGFLGFSTLEALCHGGESLLSMMRDGTLTLTTAIADALLATVDRIRQIMAAVESTETDKGVAIEDLVDRLAQLTAPDAPAAAAADVVPLALAFEAPPTEGSVATIEGPSSAPLLPAAPEAEAEAAPEAAAVSGATDDATDDATHDAVPEAKAAGRAGRRLGDILVDDNLVGRTEVEAAASDQIHGDERKIGEILADRGDVSAIEVEAAAKRQQTTERRSAADSTIRVDVDLLDDLMNLIGELVLTRNEILQYISDATDRGLAQSSQRLDLLTSELQDKVMTTRMQSIGGLWNKLPRVVRDLAHQCGKEVRIEMEGKDTELDKTLIESIKDPLTHIVRNTVDHGIEPPDIRVKNGKPAEGVLKLSAGHQDGHVVIMVVDDGGGIDLERVRAKAIEKDLVSASEAASMSDAEAVNLVFLPGFSTAEKITNVSGRGVGMDVVRTNIEKIGGSVEVFTEKGVGTTFRIEIPLTLAIVPALVVVCADRRYAIPQRSLVELVSVDNSPLGHSVEFVHDAPVIRLRNRLLPVLDLRAALEEPPRDELVGDMVVLSADGSEFSIVVDEIIETQEIVVKPLGQVVHDADIFSGATILGDGRVALILDVVGLGQQAQIVNGRAATAHEPDTSTGVVGGPAEGAEALLLLSVGDDRQVAMALPDVERLDEFELDALEMVGNRQVVQYRSEIMPLIDLGSELGYAPSSSAHERGRISVVVYRHGDRDIGLIIDRMIDIIDHGQAEVTATGNLIIHGRVTEMVDADCLPSLRMIEQEFNQTGVLQ